MTKVLILTLNYGENILILIRNMLVLQNTDKTPFAGRRPESEMKWLELYEGRKVDKILDGEAFAIKMLQRKVVLVVNGVSFVLAYNMLCGQNSFHFSTNAQFTYFYS